MALEDILSGMERGIDANGPATGEITKDRIREDLPDLQKLISFWRVYPDKFVDYLCSLNPENKFKFFFYQRV